MPTRDQIHYFGAGPAPLPTAVLEDAAKALLNYNDMGVGIAEMSHRSPEANAVLAEAKSALATLLDVPDDYEILFLQGGGSGEFAAVAYNMVSLWVERMRARVEGTLDASASPEDKFAALRRAVDAHLRMDYLVTGSWSLKASQEAARLMGPQHVHVVCDSREADAGRFRSVPDEATWKLDLPAAAAEDIDGEPVGPAFTYFCDNETVDGVEFPAFPAALAPTDAGANAPDRLVVADMSSNFLSRRVDVRRHAVIFGGAQKNIGITGVTIVIARKSLLSVPAASPALLRRLGLSVGPAVLDWPTMAKNNSLYNTLPIFDVWVAGQVMRRLVAEHGSVAGQERIADQKAALLYGVLDKHPDVYQVVPSRAARSRMNICLRIRAGDDKAEKDFVARAAERGLTGLKGHRSVGGIRISNYNAVSPAAAEKLANFLTEFAEA